MVRSGSWRSKTSAFLPRITKISLDSADQDERHGDAEMRKMGWWDEIASLSF